MELTFHSLDELDQFAEIWARGRLSMRADWAGLNADAATRDDGHDEWAARVTGAIEDAGLRIDMGETGNDWRLVPRDLRGQDDRPVTAEGAVIPNEPAGEPKGTQDTQRPAGADDGEAPDTLADVQVTPRRKRRTKAQVAADESGVGQPDAGTIIDKGDGTATFADGKGGEIGRTEPPAVETTIELHPDVLALAATLDGTDSLAHMNEARAFIASQGFPAYSETFKLTGLPSAIAGYTPEQVALHRAAMQWLTAQPDTQP